MNKATSSVFQLSRLSHTHPHMHRQTDTDTRTQTHGHRYRYTDTDRQTDRHTNTNHIRIDPHSEKEGINFVQPERVRAQERDIVDSVAVHKYHIGPGLKYDHIHDCSRLVRLLPVCGTHRVRVCEA